MFCTKCGAEIQLPAKFCSKCGMPVGEIPAPAPVSGQAYAGPAQSPVRAAYASAQMPGPAAPARTVPVPPPVSGARPVSKGKVRYGANTLVGILGAFAVYVGMFLACATASAGVAGYNVTESVSFFELMQEGDAEFVSIIVLVCIGLVVLFHLVKCPKVSLIGILGMLFGMGIFIWAVMETKSRAGGFAAISFGIGFWLYVIGIVVCMIGAFLKKNRV